MAAGRLAGVALAAAALTGCHSDTKVSTGCRETPSGLPVPRFVSLKHDPANARGGPGDDYRLLWVYHNKGLPLLVFEETTDWRKVRDPEGQLAWVHKRVLLEGARYVMRTAATPLSLRDHPATDGRVTAVLASHAIAAVKSCADNWCQISVDHASGWVPRAELWGADALPPGEGCKAR